MALIDNYLKKKDKINVERPRELLIDRYTVKERAPVVETKKESISLIDRIKGVGVGAGKFVARTGIEAANLLTSTLDFTADFLSGQIEKQKRKPSIVAGPIVIPIGKETEARKRSADRWKNFYATTGGEVTDKMKSFTQSLREIDFIKPSEEWINASNKDKFTKKLPETILNIGPGVVSSLGLFAINPVVGFAASAGSVADELKTVAMENGVSEERAELLGLGTGLLVGWIDKIVPDEVFSPQQKKAFVGGLAKRILKTGLKEGGTEVVQEDIQLLVESTVREDITKDEVITRNLMSGLGGLLGGVGVQTTVSFTNGIRSGDIGGLEEDFEVEKVERPGKVKLPEAKVEKIAIKPKVGKGEKLITVFHRTNISPETVKKKGFETLENTEEVFVSNFEKGQAEGFGKNVIKLQVKESDLRLDDEFPSGEQHFAIKKEIADNFLQKERPVEKVVVKTKLKVKEITEKQIKTTKNIKDTKSTLRNIQKELSEAVTEAEASAVIAQEKRAGVNVEDINKLKRIYGANKKFQEGDIETIRKSRTGGLFNRVVENVREIHSEMSEQEAFEFALDLPTKAEEAVRTPTIRELEKKQKKLSKFMDLLKARQDELNIEVDAELSREWTQALAIQEKLEKIVRVPKRQLPVGEGKERVSRLQARLKGALENASQEDIEELGLTTFRQMNQEDQIAKASEYVENNTEEALRVVRGEIDPPEGILQNSVFAALVELGKVDTDVATQVATLAATRFGQEINILKKILADNPVVMMQDIVKTRIEAYEKRTGGKVSERVKQETTRITKDAQATTKAQWDSFIESIRC